MKKIVVVVWITLLPMLLSIPSHLHAQNGRAQWTEKEAWEWH